MGPVVAGFDHLPKHHRMQRELHSILTARILLNLREAAYRDCASREVTVNDTVTWSVIDEANTPTTFSSVIIGVDTWFRDTRARSRVVSADVG